MPEQPSDGPAHAAGLPSTAAERYLSVRLDGLFEREVTPREVSDFYHWRWQHTAHVCAMVHKAAVAALEDHNGSSAEHPWALVGHYVKWRTLHIILTLQVSENDGPSDLSDDLADIEALSKAALSALSESAGAFRAAFARRAADRWLRRLDAWHRLGCCGRVPKADAVRNQGRAFEAAISGALRVLRPPEWNRLSQWAASIASVAALAVLGSLSGLWSLPVVPTASLAMLVVSAVGFINRGFRPSTPHR